MNDLQMTASSSIIFQLSRQKTGSEIVQSSGWTRYQQISDFVGGHLIWAYHGSVCRSKPRRKEVGRVMPWRVFIFSHEQLPSVWRFRHISYTYIRDGFLFGEILVPKCAKYKSLMIAGCGSRNFQSFHEREWAKNCNLNQGIACAW